MPGRLEFARPGTGAEVPRWVLGSAVCADLGGHRLSSHGTIPNPPTPAVVIVDAGVSAGPWLLRLMKSAFGPEGVDARITSRFPAAATSDARMAFLVCEGSSPAEALAGRPGGMPVTVVLTSADTADEEAAISAGAFDVLVLPEASPHDVRRAMLRMARALDTESALAERTQALADSRKHIHDINNALATILTVAEELLDNPVLDQQAKRAAALIFETTRKAALTRPANPAPARQSLPPAVEATTERESGKPAASGGSRVLVIEDQADLGRLVSLTLKSKGYDVLLAQSADEAIEMARQAEWQVRAILSDIVMEGRSTSDAVAEIREHAPGVGVVFMSAYAPEEFFATGEIPDDAHFLQKPFTAAELAGAMKSAISE